MYDVLPSFTLGFHGCDKAVAKRVFGGKATLKASQNAYDWLGHGVYFWENNPARALDYADELKKHPARSSGKISTPAVVGAVIDLGRCLNLLDAQSIELVRDGYQQLEATMQTAGKPLPVNKAPAQSAELLLRYLDCAVIEFVHQIRRKEREEPFDSVRGVFIEGKPLYPKAGFHEKSHIQICVRDPRCIKGYFRVIGDPPEGT